MPDNKKHIPAVPIVKKGEIAIATIRNDYRMRWNGDIQSTPVVTAFTFGNVYEFRKKAVIIKQCVHLHCAFLWCVMYPFVERHGQRDGR